jgi:hypothetical protein
MGSVKLVLLMIALWFPGDPTPKFGFIPADSMETCNEARDDVLQEQIQVQSAIGGDAHCVEFAPGTTS